MVDPNEILGRMTGLPREMVRESKAVHTAPMITLMLERFRVAMQPIREACDRFVRESHKAFLAMALAWASDRAERSEVIAARERKRCYRSGKPTRGQRVRDRRARALAHVLSSNHRTQRRGG